jgi:purine nucleoside phosphorylase
LARRFGLPFAAIALVTSYAAGFAGGRPSSEQTATALAANIGPLKRLIKTFVRAA